MAEGNSNRVKSVIKAMKIYEKLVNRGEPISLSVLSKKVGINISTVHRLLNTLLQLGYVEQDEKGYYCLGIRSYKMADIISESFDLKKIVRPYLVRIVEECNETTNLVIMEDYQVVYIDQVESNNMVRMFASVGIRGYAYCTGAGKVLLAYLPEEELEMYLKKNEFKAFTENTIIEPDLLKEELEKIKKQGYALDLEEKEEGVRCVAAPIFSRDKKVVAAVSVSGPCSRISRQYLEEELIPLVRSNVAQISSKLN